MVSISAWNELLESYAVEPSVEYGFAYLNIIRDIFCEESPEGFPPNLVPTISGTIEYEY